MSALTSAERLRAFMEETVTFADEHVREGGIPFTALVVTPDGTVVGRGVNRVRCHHDATAHAEIDAIRDAGRTLQTPHLGGAVLFASGEPCAMCYVGALYAGVSAIYFAADRHEAARGGFDYRGSYHLLARDPLRWTAPTVAKLPVERSLAPFETFQRRLHGHEHRND